MAQDYSAWFDSMDFPPWRADVPGDGTDALGVASTKVWSQILSVARRELGDTFSAEVRRTLTVEAWEDTLLSVAETLKRHKGKERIRNLEAYLVGIFQHRLSRAIVREKNFAGTVECLPSSQDLAELRHARDEDYPANLHKQILIKELLRRMDEWTRKVWMELKGGYSWKKIAKHLGMNEHQLKMRFRYNIEKLKREIEGENGGATPPDAA